MFIISIAHSVIDSQFSIVKALVGAFNKEKALIGSLLLFKTDGSFAALILLLQAKCAPASAAGSRCPLLGRSKHCCSAHKTENWVSKVQTLTTFTCHMRCNPEMSVSFSFFLSFLRQTRSGFRNNCNFKLRLHFADCTRQKVHYNSFSANLKLPDYK